jgi:hypothetical protein
LVGGLLEAALLIVGMLVAVSPVLPVLARITVELAPFTCIGAGLVAVGVSIRGRGHLPLLIAGILYLGGVVVNGLQIATFSPFGPGPSFLAAGAAFVAVMVAAALLLSDGALRGTARWALAIPAACIVLQLVGLYTPGLGSVPTDLFPWIGFAIAGTLLLRRTHPEPVRARPVAT